MNAGPGIAPEPADTLGLAGAPVLVVGAPPRVGAALAAPRRAARAPGGTVGRGTAGGCRPRMGGPGRAGELRPPRAGRHADASGAPPGGEGGEGLGPGPRRPGRAGTGRRPDRGGPGDRVPRLPVGEFRHGSGHRRRRRRERMTDLRGHTALVTGGAPGIGRATATALPGAGAAVG